VENNLKRRIFMDVSPFNQNIDSVFSNTTFNIDFYQRDYKWTEEPVSRFLDDIFFKFDQEYEKHKALDPKKEVVAAKYPWYYLNTYVTNEIDGKVYIVDGQQRLTTISLTLMKLLHMSKFHQSSLQNWIERKIVGYSGYSQEFWLCHENHKDTQNKLFEGVDPKTIDTSRGITSSNMVKNYQTISLWLERELTDKHKFETFVFYFLFRLVLIHLKVEQTDVPMIFEAINDRGVRLKPYEILKGKLLGQIDKQELDDNKYNELWENKLHLINSYSDDEIDSFFRYYLKAKYASTRKEGQEFDGDYHRVMFTNSMDARLKLNHNPVAVKRFLENEFTYYTSLYEKLLAKTSDFYSEFPHLYFNKLNDLDSQFIVIISGCCLNDPNEDAKINTIAYEVDRLFSLLQIQNGYDSNKFNDALFKISHEIRELGVEHYRAVFNKYLFETLGDRRGAEVSDPFQYAYFKNTGIGLNTRFKRYFFARIDYFLAINTNLQMKHPINDLVLRTGHVNGFHVEHILAHNDVNLAAFNNDEDLFEQERNRLGGILLLKGRDNISSNNEPYSEKLKTYANTLYWNESLREDFYKSKKDLEDMKKKFNLDALKALANFGASELEFRQKLLYDISAIIWK
jgi:uncharacterized protein with ParB-like and HNH nuclease domain